MFNLNPLLDAYERKFAHRVYSNIRQGDLVWRGQGLGQNRWYAIDQTFEIDIFSDPTALQQHFREGEFTAPTDPEYMPFSLRKHDGCIERATIVQLSQQHAKSASRILIGKVMHDATETTSRAYHKAGFPTSHAWNILGSGPWFLFDAGITFEGMPYLAAITGVTNDSELQLNPDVGVRYTLEIDYRELIK